MRWSCGILTKRTRTRRRRKMTYMVQKKAITMIHTTKLCHLSQIDRQPQQNGENPYFSRSACRPLLFLNLHRDDRFLPMLGAPQTLESCGRRLRHPRLLRTPTMKLNGRAKWRHMLLRHRVLRNPKPKQRSGCPTGLPIQQLVAVEVTKARTEVWVRRPRLHLPRFTRTWAVKGLLTEM